MYIIKKSKPKKAKDDFYGWILLDDDDVMFTAYNKFYTPIRFEVTGGVEMVYSGIIVFEREKAIILKQFLKNFMENVKTSFVKVPRGTIIIEAKTNYGKVVIAEKVEYVEEEKKI